MSIAVDTRAEQLARRVCALAPIVGEVVLEREADGWAAVVHLDPLVVRARADQQGLRDWSIAAAAVAPRVRSVVADAIAQASAEQPLEARIVRHRIAV